MIPHTRTILTPATADQHHRVLLHVVALPGDVARHDAARTQPHTRRLAFRRVGLLGLGDADFEADAFELRGLDVVEGRGDGLAGALRDAAALGLVSM